MSALSSLSMGVFQGTAPDLGPGSPDASEADVALRGSQQVFSLNECCKLTTSPATASIITGVVNFVAHFLMSYISPGYDLPAGTSQAVMS